MRALLAALLLAACTTQPMGECDMGLPTSRDETLTSASKVRSALINKLQDCIIDGNHRGTFTRLYWPVLHQPGSFVPSSASIAEPSISYYSGTTPGQIGIESEVGDYITGLSYWRWDSSTSQVQVRCYYANPSGFTAPTQLATVTDAYVSNLGKFVPIALPAFTSQLIAPGSGIFLALTPIVDGTDWMMGRIAVTFTHP